VNCFVSLPEGETMEKGETIALFTNYFESYEAEREKARYDREYENRVSTPAVTLLARNVANRAPLSLISFNRFWRTRPHHRMRNFFMYRQDFNLDQNARATNPDFDLGQNPDGEAKTKWMELALCCGRRTMDMSTTR
jgi:hypothetical protein